MAATGVASGSVLRGGVIVRGGGMALPEMQGGVAAARIAVPGCSSRCRLVSPGGSSTSRTDWRVFAWQGVESSAAGAAPAKEDIRVADGLLHPKVGSTSPREFDNFQSRGWSEAACDEGSLLKDGGALAVLRAREAFVSGGDITEANMERLVESLLSEKGQSREDYRLRAELFGKIADFFSQGKAYSVEKAESPSASSGQSSRTMQRLLDVILAEDGRSATDYNARAQVFAQSAQVFPFNSEVRSI